MDMLLVMVILAYLSLNHGMLSIKEANSMQHRAHLES